MWSEIARITYWISAEIFAFLLLPSCFAARLGFKTPTLSSERGKRRQTWQMIAPGQ